MKFKPGIQIEPLYAPLGFKYLEDTCGPAVENRTLDSIRKSLLNPECEGPEVVYSIAMDVYDKKDYPDLLKRNLLYGVVTYAKGLLGEEPVRSQGHIHAISPSCNASTCEVYEIWEGEAIIYMQESGKDDPGRCYAVCGRAGDVIIVPPGWVHATINADPATNMTFGAWCVRDFGFDYKDVRAHGGIAYFPVVRDDILQFEQNPNYNPSELIIKTPRLYTEFHLEKDVPIYTQYQNNPDLFNFVKDPETVKDLWINFEP